MLDGLGYLDRSPTRCHDFKGPFGDLLAIVSRSGYSSCRPRELCAASQSVGPLGFVSERSSVEETTGERSRRADAGTQSILAGPIFLGCFQVQLGATGVKQGRDQILVG